MPRVAARVAVLAAALTVAGCSSVPSTYEWSELRASPREFYNLDAPVVLATAEADAGRVVLKRGQALVLKLDGEIGSGYRWEMQRYDGPTVIAPVRHDFTAKPGTTAAAAGGLGDATFRMRGIAAGTQPVVLEYKRAFDSVAAKTVRFDVVVP